MSNILDQIVAVKWQEVAAARARVGEAALRQQAAEQAAPRGFAAALREELFSPSRTTPMPLVDAYTGQHKRSYRPVLYEILREPAGPHDGGPDLLRPLQVTLILDPVAETAV